MTNWGILSCLVKQTRLSWTDTQSSPYRGVQPCAAVTLQYTLGSLANIKPPQPPILVRRPSSLTQLHVWNGNITAHRLSEKKRRPLFSSLAISSRCSAVKFEIHAWILSSFLKPFFCMRPLLNLFSLQTPPPSFPLEFSGSPPSYSLSPRTFVWLVWLDWEEMGSVVIKTGGNRIHSHLVQA